MVEHICQNCGMGFKTPATSYAYESQEVRAGGSVVVYRSTPIEVSPCCDDEFETFELPE